MFKSGWSLVLFVAALFISVGAVYPEDKGWLSYNSAEFLKERYGLPQDLVQNIAVVETLAVKAGE